MQLIIRTLFGKCLSVEVNLETTVHELKTKIQEEYGYAVPIQKLILCGACMDDNKTLGFYQVHKETTVHIVICKDVLESTSNMESSEAPKHTESD